MGRRKQPLQQDLPTISPGQTFVQIIDTNGGYVYSTKDFLVKLPSKFHNAVFIKRGSWVIVEPCEEGRVTHIIVWVLTPADIKYLKGIGLWTAEEMVDVNITADSDDLFENTNRYESEDEL
jgi:probable RNA-binding protein EIF1AD